MERQKFLRTQKIHTRFFGLFKSWRWRALFGVTLIGLTALPLSLIIDVQKAQALPCVCTVFTNPSGNFNFSEGSDLELGFKFSASVDGYITGVRFYKQGSMGGTHVGRLWTSGGSPITSATFTSETASGWQEVTFSTPVEITANTTYVASVTMNDGNYTSTSNGFSSTITNGPLTAPSSASSGGNGVFSVNAGEFPTSSFNATNYWIDVSFFDETAPQVSSVTPTDASTNVAPGEAVTATFDQSLNSSTVTSSTFTVQDSDSNPVSGTVSYTASTKTVSFKTPNGFTLGETYTATLEGGTIVNGAGLALASDYVWSFTITATEVCPCTLKARAGPAGSTTIDDSGQVELGVKVKPTTNGYITALRFYKPITSAETTHTGNIWSSTGSLLATATFEDESDYGWQEARLSSPLQVNDGQLYIISYGTTSAIYQTTVGGLNSALGSGYLVAPADNSSENAATGSGNRNGVFTVTAGNYPLQGSTNGAYYWIDAVFAPSSTAEYPLNVTVTQPTGGSFGAPRDGVITASFNRTLDPATVTNSTFRLFDASNNPVSGTGTYDTGRGMAVFTPSSALTNGQQYTARLSASVADPAGTTLGTEQSWTFTVGSALSSDPTQGPGGPLLVITSTTNKYSTYYAEILRAEGLNYFDVKDISTVNATVLNSYDAAIVAEMSLDASQASMFSSWVNSGGNLIAMRPDGDLANLLGLTAAGTTRANQYLLIDTSTTPGNGLVDETIQFKGTADNYSLSGASALATFYSDASTSTTNPAVTTRQVGSNGGTAVAFAYDLAKSVIAQHQGNQAWAGQNRDGNAPIRSNDLFFGAMTGDVQPDWVESSKFHIPQADEQQRLLANIITEASKDRRPMPRFWYLPGDHEAAMVMAGDDHGLSNAAGTEKVLNRWLNESPTDCSVVDWECVRASHYIYESSSLTPSRAVQFYEFGNEIADHVGTTCTNFASYAALGSTYTTTLATWRAKYTGLPNQATHRYHCYVWSDWDSQTRVDADNDIRFDLNYVAYPASWVGSKAPLMTGSGLNMRLTDADGDLMDVRQGVTNFDNTATTSTNINALLDNALGADGYYGIFGTHYDMSDTFETTLFDAAKAKNVPMITSVQALNWLEGRDSSTFSSFTGSNGQFGFTIAAAEGATNMRAMLPILDAGGQLDTLKLGSTDVTYDTRTVKGVQYAVFDANPGAYTATYTDYDPNAGGGGSSGGTGGSGGSQSGGSASTGSSKKRASGGTGQNAETEEPGEEVAVTPPQNTETAEENETEKEFITQTGEKDGISWIFWVIGAFLLGGIVFWIIFAIRRRHREITF